MTAGRVTCLLFLKDYLPIDWKIDLVGDGGGYERPVGTSWNQLEAGPAGEVR